jgi:hypothetical protein
LENLFVLFCHKPMFDFVGEIHFCKQEIVWVTIRFSLPICVLAGKLKSLKFSVNIDRYVKIHAIFFLWVCVWIFWLLYNSLSVHLLRFHYSHAFMAMFNFILCLQDSFECLLECWLYSNIQFDFLFISNFYFSFH